MEGGEFENYSETSKDYDTGRQPVGLEVFLGAIAQLTNGDLKKASLVDIGCGTGNYTCALAPYVGQITGVEFNSGMLEQAKKKTANLQNVKLMQGDATAIPLPNGYCDVVYCTQVIHHLPIENGNFTGFNKFVQESYRVLKDRGIFILNTCSPRQSKDCWIGAGLAPIAGKLVSNRFPSTEHIVSEFERAGYKLKSVNMHGYPNLHHPKVLNDPDGPLSDQWRALESTWSLSPKEELERVQKQWKERQLQGTTGEYFEERQRMIHQIGETTTFVAYKPAAAASSETPA